MADTPVLFTDYLKALDKSPESVILKLAKQLKAAGLYKGTPTGKFNNSFYDALIKAEDKRIQLVSIQGELDRTNFITQLASQGTGTGTGGPSTTRARSITSKTKGASTLDAIGQELLGRELTDAEKAKYLKMLNAEEKKATSDTVTKYSAAGDMSTTTTGLDKEQFLIEKISGTDEAKANKVLDAYTTVVNMLGGLR